MDTKRIRMIRLVGTTYMPRAVYFVPLDLANKMVRDGNASLEPLEDEDVPAEEVETPEKVETPEVPTEGDTPSGDAEPTLEELRAVAKENGIKGYNLMGLERLREELGLDED